MSKAAELAALIGSGQAQGDKNLIINGAMQVAQRGVDINAVSNGGFCTDRFKFAINNLDNLVLNLDQSTDAPAGFSTSLKASVGTAESSLATDEYLQFGQRIEGQNLQHLIYGSGSAKTLTLSFYVKSSLTGTYAISLFQSDASSSPDRRYYSKTYTIDSANTWEFKTITIDGNVNDIIDNDNGEGLRVNWTLSAGSDYTSGSNDVWGDNTNWAVGHNVSWITNAGATFYITGVQLELGDVGTAFEHESFAETLQKCRRYFIGVGNIYSDFWGSTGTQMVGVFIGAHQNNAFMPINVLNPTKMRATPTAAINGTPKFTDFASNRNNITGVAIDSLHLIHFTYDGSQRTANEGIGINLGDSGVGLSLSAEL